MSIILLNLQSNQQIQLDHDNPFIIGRGNVEGCFDKRVSRNHGKITCTPDGKIRLAALHCNPCFFTRNGIPPVVQLNKDEEETLSEGDYLGLLPNAFWFKITSNGDKRIKKEIDSSKTAVTIDENTETNLPSKSESLSISQADKTIYNDSAKCIANNENSKIIWNPSPVPNSGSLHRLGTPEFEKTRRLPIWMYEIDEPIEFCQKSPRKHSQLSCTEAKRKKHMLLSDPEIENESQTLDDAKKVKEEIIDLDVPSTSKVENTNESPSAVVKAQVQNNAPTQGEPGIKNSKKEGYESDVENAGDSGTKRPICQYEGSCYRNNTQHKIEFCHPGDSDYIPYEERPLCQYGATCYRRNERHRVEFRHPTVSSSNNFSSTSCPHDSVVSSPLPPKRRRKKVITQNFDYESDNDYSLEDPFINDDSSDEYVPSDLDSEEEEKEDKDLIIHQEDDS